MIQLKKILIFQKNVKKCKYKKLLRWQDWIRIFATAHEDKDVSGDESDGFPKIAHKEMDLHNNEVGRYIGEENGNASEDELADIIYSNIYSESTQFVWLHD